MSEPFRERLALGVIAVISVVAHFANLTHPSEVVFDEFHFGKFVNAYCCTHQTIFDIHPPHTKLVMAWLVKLWGYDGGFDFKSIGEPLAAGPLFAFRLWPAIVGSLIPVVGFLLLRTWGVAVVWAFTGALALALENGILIQTRIMALDGQLLLGSLVSVLAFEWMLRARTSIRQVIHAALVGLALAVTVSAKFTGLAVMAILGFRLLQHFAASGLKPRWSWVLVAKVAVGVAAFLLLYLGGWKLHFMWLTEPGPGTAFYQPTGNFLKDVAVLHKVMVKANDGITASHPWSSPWWGWPVMKKPIYYWVDNGAVIFFAGNPVVWWGALATSVLMLGYVVATGTRRGPYLDMLVVGWFASYIPYALVSRGLFLYHYLPPLMWLILLATLLLSRMPERSPVKPWHVMALITCGFVISMPVTFGFIGWKAVPTWLLNLH
jgi:dolichyl-phosphate-mannose-protein mannosyltransferase